MRIPFTNYTLGQIRKALSGGLAAVVPLLTVGEHDAWALLGTFLAGAALVFFVPNKQSASEVKLADAFLGNALPAIAPQLHQVAQAAEQTVATAAEA